MTMTAAARRAAARERQRATERTRRYRRRKLDGLTRVPGFDLTPLPIEHLVATAHLTPGRQDDPRAIAEAIRRLLEESAEAWVSSR